MNRPVRSLVLDQAPILDGYRPLDGVYDEMMDPSGAVRPGWRGFLGGLAAMSENEVRRCWETAQGLIRENGTTYNVYEDNHDVSHPWRLDPIPLLIGAHEWRELETGLIQRARLLNDILADIYGPQRLLKEGALPPELVYANPAFMRPVHDIAVRENAYLHLVAFDLARTADSQWWVLSDRTQAPSGAGYALENRVVMTRTLPNLFRQFQVRRLSHFFQTLSDELIRITDREDPLVVLLSPGPMNETYFEHAYLARYLGIPLVEGADLTVRDNRVFLKTLIGLKQVDLIFRRVDSEYCDPLELRTDSLLGVAGLVAAVRAGNVVVANALGSGLIECEALMSFLPGLCRRMFGEELMIPSVATWWCGQEAEKNFVRDNIDRLVIQPAFSRTTILSRGRDAVLPGTLAPDARADLLACIGRQGYRYIGQETLSLSTTPGWRDGRLSPCPMVFRAYLVRDRDGYRAMPGGLTRTADALAAQSITMQQGDASKDTWVLWDSPVGTFTRLPRVDQDIILRRSGTDLPSRVADNLFWLGRYAERLEGAARLLRSLTLRLAGEVDMGSDPAILERLTRILVDFGFMRAPAARRAAGQGVVAVEHELSILMFDPAARGGLLGLLDNLKRTASLVRERLSGDASRILNALYDVTRQQADKERLDVSTALALLNAIVHELAGFSGMQMENMTRSPGWRLLDAGRRIERTLHMCRLIRELAIGGERNGSGGLELLLELGDSSMTYRTRYLSAPLAMPVIDLLLVDDTNPRSVAFQMAALEEHMNNLPRDAERATLTREQHLVASIRSEVRLADLQELCRTRGKHGRRLRLERMLKQIETRLNELSDSIARTYFSHVVPVPMTATGGFAP